MTKAAARFLALSVLAVLAGSGPFNRAMAQTGVAYLAVDLGAHVDLRIEQAAILDTPLLPGSILKVATIAAALESGVIGPRSGIACDGVVVVGSHRLVCTHPDFHRPLTPSEALAHSCNVYAAAAAARLSRTALDRALSALGLPPTDPRVPVPAAALGLDGIRVAPRRLVEMVARVTADPTSLRWAPSTLAVLRDGLRDAARTGTASALADAGLDALAKTGTTITAGREQGLVVGVMPSVRPSIGFVLVASGASGKDASALAAERLAVFAGSAPSSGSGQFRGSPNTRGSSVLPGADQARVRIGVARDDGGYSVRDVPLEEYVAGVVAAEAAASSRPAALEALAITGRTFAAANRGRHRADGFDLCDLTHCQVFGKATPASSRAAAATAGRVLLHDGAPAHVFYTASCGGYTERPSNVWPGSADASYLPSRPDDACGGEPSWSAELRAADLVRALRAGNLKGDGLRGLRVGGRDQSGRVARVRIDGFAPAEISGEDFRSLVGRVLGWQHIKSTAFDIVRTASGFRFDGRGSGHGVGLCVLGSARLADRGESAAQILARYFPGLTISTSDVRLKPEEPPPVRPKPDTTNGEVTKGGVAKSGSIVVVLPEAEEGERAVIVDLAARSRDLVAKQLRVAAPDVITLRFHPTVESYQRATGQPWFTTAATSRNVIDLIPLAILRQRKTIDVTLRHEMVHVLAEPSIADRPRWVREGAAAYFAGERRGRRGADVRLDCPTDQELLHPASATALGAAYSRAAACFDREIAAGRTWREVR
jgi:SpoIID/LytB domain protein